MAKTTETIITLPYRDRVKMAQERIRSIQRPSLKVLPKPAKVIAAEKVVHEWETKADEYDRLQRAEHRNKLNAITDALIVGDMAKAVSLLQKFGA